jgi:hypothetical protein
LDERGLDDVPRMLCESCLAEGFPKFPRLVWASAGTIAANDIMKQTRALEVDISALRPSETVAPFLQSRKVQFSGHHVSEHTALHAMRSYSHSASFVPLLPPRWHVATAPGATKGRLLRSRKRRFCKLNQRRCECRRPISVICLQQVDIGITVIPIPHA